MSPAPRDVTKPVPSTPQKISTTSIAYQVTAIAYDKYGQPTGTGPVLVSDGVLSVDSQALQNGGNDWIYGNAGRDMLVGGPGSDAIDGGNQDDLIFGDNASVGRTRGDWTSPRFQALCGMLLYSRSDLANPCGGTVNEYNSGQLLTNGIAMNFRTANDVPWWAEYDVLNLWHDFGADNGLKWAGSFGNDYIAGGPQNDLILGQLGDDTIQGDGSIDWVAPGSPTSAFGGIPVVQRVGAYRTPGTCTGVAGHVVCDPTGPLTVYPSVERASDGEDYIEGNAGNDVIFGNLGQDDLVGGSSDFFSLDTPYKRPDGGDYALDGSGTTGDLGRNIIFGGAGTEIGINNQVTSLADGTRRPATDALANQMHARDADTIVGANGDIIRIVGINGVDTAGASVDANGVLVPACTSIDCHALLSDPATMRYLTYNWDTYDASTCTPSACTYSPNGKVVVHGVTLLDYTPGGPDFRPDLFFPPNTPGQCSTSPATGACSTPLPTAHGLDFSSADCAASPAGCVLSDIGGINEIHAESGDDVVYAGPGTDYVFGDAGNDQITGGWGNDWISGGTGGDTVLGDDGRIFASRNSATGVTWNGSTWVAAGCTANAAGCYSEPLFGILSLLATDPDLKNSNGNALNEYIYTPGKVQTATINVAGALNTTVDETPFNLTPRVLGAAQPLFDANNSDDVIFGGWGNDELHGGSGDDAISGSEALAVSYAQAFDDQGNPIGLVETDFNHPWNPGDILHFGADTNAWHSNHHVASRLGEFLLYDEYDPRRIILFNADGSVWKGGTGQTFQYFLNNDATLGNLVLACLAVDNQGNCTLYSQDPTKPYDSTKVQMTSDGNDVLFGDLGNDWMVGGTGNDTIYGGWGNDLMNADDNLATGCAVYGNGGKCATPGLTGLGDIPDGPNSSYEDRVFGGAGLDILIGNTGGDRLIDWVGEFNSYIVPFAPFGIATVSRQNDPALPEFLYALSRSQGADPTRATDTGDSPARNGEPDGELGLIRQQDHGLWQQQTGGPTDPQAGNIPGGPRDVLRSADFNDGTAALAPDSGTWQVTNGALAVAAASLGQDAAAVLYVDDYLPIYYEIAASVEVQKPTGGWKANAYVIFDYFSPTDFKFAGIDVAINKIVMGYRDVDNWHVEVQSSIPGGLKANRFYSMLVAVNGTTVTVQVDGTLAFTYTFAPRIIDGDPVGLNKGLVGLGSDNSQGVFDNVAVQKLPPQVTLDAISDFTTASAPLAAPALGTWTRSGGRYAGTATSGTNAVDLIDFAALGTTDSGFAFTAYLEARATVRTAGIAGIVFDGYSATDFKFAAIDVPGQRIIIGHVDPRRGWIVDAFVARTLVAGTDYALDVVMKATTVSISINGSFALSTSFNAAVVDGAVGLLGRTGTVDAASFRVTTDDPAFAGSAPPPPPPSNPSVSVEDLSVSEGNSGSTVISVAITLSQSSTSTVTVPWSTSDGTATAGSDYVAGSGTVTFNPGETTRYIGITIDGDITIEPDETFTIRLGVPTNADIARGLGTITILNDDTAPATPTISIGSATITEGDKKTSTVQVLVSLSAAWTSTITVSYTTVAGSALPGSDYQTLTGTVTFNPGVTQQYVTLRIVNDRTPEPTETFTVQLSKVSGGATLANATGTVTILDNDGYLLAASAGPGTAAGTLSLADATATLATALAAWRAQGADVDALGVVGIRIESLPGADLAVVDGRTIVLDADAAGWGWSTDATTVTPGRMDLATVLLHEVGHLLGYEHGAPGFMHDVMQPTLEPGTRRVLVPAPLPVSPVRPAPVDRIAPVPVLPIAPNVIPAVLSPEPSGPSTSPLGGLLVLLVAGLGLAWVSQRRRPARTPAWIRTGDAAPTRRTW